MQSIIQTSSPRSTKGWNQILSPVRKQLSVTMVRWPSSTLLCVCLSECITRWCWLLLLILCEWVLRDGSSELFSRAGSACLSIPSVSERKVVSFLQSWCVPRTSIRCISHLAAGYLTHASLLCSLLQSTRDKQAKKYLILDPVWLVEFWFLSEFCTSPARGEPYKTLLLDFIK